MNLIPKVILIEVTSLKDLPTSFLTHYQTHISCHSGHADFKFKGKSYTCKKDDFVFWFAESDVTGLFFSSNFKATVLLVEKDFLMNNVPDQSWSIDVQLYSRAHPILNLNFKEDKTKILINFKRLNDMFLDNKHLFYDEILNLQMKMFLLDMWNIFSNSFNRRNRTLQSGTLYERFLYQVSINCMKEREVNFYALKLNITAKHLNFVCKQNSEITASDWIKRYVKERLILLLENKSLNISEISDQMNFSSRSFFTRYVKNILGFTPSEYRNRLK